MRQLTDKQLRRVEHELLRRAPRDAFGADWSTLNMTMPGLYHSLRALAKEVARRNRERMESAA